MCVCVNDETSIECTKDIRAAVNTYSLGTLGAALTHPVELHESIAAHNRHIGGTQAKGGGCRQVQHWGQT